MDSLTVSHYYRYFTVPQILGIIPKTSPIFDTEKLKVAQDEFTILMQKRICRPYVTNCSPYVTHAHDLAHLLEDYIIYGAFNFEFSGSSVHKPYIPTSFEPFELDLGLNLFWQICGCIYNFICKHFIHITLL